MLKPEAQYVIVSVVTPETDDPATSGRVINIPCAPTVSHPMLERNGPTWSLRAAYRDRGYTTMEACYAQEHNEDGAAAWVKLIEDSQAGKRVGTFPREKLPKEVLRRQACGEIDTVKALEDAKRTAPVTSKVTK
jgi:hypothetical protein